MSQLHGLVRFVQEAIQNGATSVEEIHKSLANQPFEILKNYVSDGTQISEFQKMSNDTIGSVYETIRNVNNQAADIAKDLLAKAGIQEEV